MDTEKTSIRSNWSLKTIAQKLRLVSFLVSYFEKDLPKLEQRDKYVPSESQEISPAKSLAVIDTSHWKTSDKSWSAERKANWPRIEGMLSQHKSKKALAIIKQYYVRGKMPNWLELKEWKNPERHLDIFCFIWLHPSKDERVLAPLRDEYLNSDLIVMGDISSGFEIFIGAINPSCRNYKSEHEINRVFTDGNNELLFKILMGDLSVTKIEIQGYTSRDPIVLDDLPKRYYNFPKSSFGAICSMSNWLCIETMYPINEDMIFQYDLPLEWWYQSCETEEGYFEKPRYKGSRKYLEKALYRIYHFDTVKEGDTCRTRFVGKIRRILDERPFIKDFDDIWVQVKSGKTRIENGFVI